MDPVVILGSETVSVGPGQEHRLPVRIRNQGRRVESYRVDLVGAPAPFAQVQPAVVSVLPGREAEVDVIFRPPGGAGTPTGTLPFAVRATSEVDASSSAVTEGRLVLSGVAGLQAWAPETTRTGRWSARYHVEFANQGNAAARLALTAHDPTAVTVLELTPDVIDLSPGGRSTANLKVKTREPFLRGSPVNRNLQVTCQTFPFGAARPVPGGVPPQGDPNHRTFQLTFQQKPVLPKFAIPLIVLLAAGLLAFAVITLRRGEQPTLDVTVPLSPTGLTATGGPNSILLAWDAVPNAEGYQVRQTSAGGIPAEEPVGEELPPEQHTLTVDQELLADTEYCYKVRALGPAELTSALTDQICARTSQATTLQAPTDVIVATEGSDQYRVTWVFPADVADVAFEIIVDQVPIQPPAIASGAKIELLPAAEARTVSVNVRAVRGEEKSPASEPPFLVEVPAVAVGDVVPSTSPAPPTTPGIVVPPTSPPGSGETATTPPAAPPTTSPAAVTEIQNLEPTFVAMLRQVTLPADGGKPVPEQIDELATAYSLAATDIDMFSNRDTVVVSSEGTSTLPFAEAPASRRWFYVTRADQTAAEATCAGDTTSSCVVLRLSGAAAASEGKQIILLDPVPSGATTADVDQRLDQLRDQLNRDSIHVLNGADYVQFSTGRLIIFATGFDNAADAAAFCETNASVFAQCSPVELLPAD